MNTLTTVLTLVLLLVAIFVVFSFIYFWKNSRRASGKRLKRIRVLYDKMKYGGKLTGSEIYSYAKNPLTREDTYRFLEYYNLDDLFPPEFYNIESGAESHLATWLEFPTELNSCPDIIEYVKQVAFRHGDVNTSTYYHVYKFRMNEPHLAAKFDGCLVSSGPTSTTADPMTTPMELLAGLMISIVRPYRKKKQNGFTTIFQVNIEIERSYSIK